MGKDYAVVAVLAERSRADAAIKEWAGDGFALKHLSVVRKGYQAEETVAVPHDSVMRYETASKADNLLVMAHESSARQPVPV